VYSSSHCAIGRIGSKSVYRFVSFYPHKTIHVENSSDLHTLLPESESRTVCNMIYKPEIR
jgi:leucyl aminopeptidase (aminopeptidase T)